MPNFVQIYAKVYELWAINEIQNGGGRHLEFIIFVHFGQMVYIRCQPSTSVQNFIDLRQSAAELLLFVQKSKMAVAAILNYNFVMLYHPQSPFVHLKIPFKFCVDRVCTFRDIAIRKFCKFGLKCLFSPPNHVLNLLSWISFLVLSFIKIGWKIWEQWGLEILAFPLTWHIAYTTPCCYRTQAVMK